MHRTGLNNKAWPVLLLLSMLSALAGCGGDSGPGNELPSAPGGAAAEDAAADTSDSGLYDDWLVSTAWVADGGVGRDGIPSVDDPEFVTGWRDQAYLRDDHRVVIFPSDRQERPHRVYPVPILDWHEVVNDRDARLVVTWCPLTGSAVLFNDARVQGSTVGVSGWLYNNNLIFFDRREESFWVQMLMQAVAGPARGATLETLPHMVTSAATAALLAPGALILSTETGHQRPYGESPYRGYTNTLATHYPVSHVDRSLHPKHRVLGVLVDGRGKAFRAAGDRSSPPPVHNDVVGSRAVVVIRSAPHDLNVAYFSAVAGHGELTFSMAPRRQDIFPLAIQDRQTGSIWNVFGEAVEGPLKGARLASPNALTAYWFAWAAIYPDSDLAD